VYAAQLGPFAADDGTLEYYATATGGMETFCDPPQAPENLYILNIMA
jgi:hypothetical protein